MHEPTPESDSTTTRAVSPVIGVILLVAITVILAAVITGLVMDIDPGSEPAQAGYEIDQQTTDDTLDSLTVTVTSATSLDATRFEGGPDCEFSATADDLDSTAASTDLIDAGLDDCEAGDELSIVGVYEGEETVIQTIELAADAPDASGADTTE